MKVRVLVLLMAGVLFLSPLAMAGELGSSDSNFLFSSDRVAATTISSQEMQDTAGQQLIISVIPLLSPTIGEANGSIFNACSVAVLGGSCANVITSVSR
jgi:hypothetical protein